MAYYAVYHLVAQTLGRKTLEFNGRHEAVRDAMYAVPPAETSDTLRVAKRHWNQLWVLRVKADYNCETVFTESEARIALAHAEEIFASHKG